MADREFTQRAAMIARDQAEVELIQASRDFEDSQRMGDEQFAADAMRRYASAKSQYDQLTGASQQQQRSGELSNAQRNFLSRRAALGDDLTPSRMKDYSLAHTRAVNAGLEVDSPQYFAAVERSVDTMGDGRQPLLNEREAARICGVSDEVYAQNAYALQMAKLRGERD